MTKASVACRLCQDWVLDCEGAQLPTRQTLYLSGLGPHRQTHTHTHTRARHASAPPPHARHATHTSTGMCAPTRTHINTPAARHTHGLGALLFSHARARGPFTAHPHNLTRSLDTHRHATPPPACYFSVGGPRGAENANNRAGVWGESGGQAGQGLPRARAPLCPQTHPRGAPRARFPRPPPPQRVISASEGCAEPKTRAIGRESGGCPGHNKSSSSNGNIGNTGPGLRLGSGVCVFITAVPITNLFAWGGGG